MRRGVFYPIAEKRPPTPIDSLFLRDTKVCAGHVAPRMGTWYNLCIYDSNSTRRGSPRKKRKLSCPYSAFFPSRTRTWAGAGNARAQIFRPIKIKKRLAQASSHLSCTKNPISRAGEARQNRPCGKNARKKVANDHGLRS